MSYFAHTLKQMSKGEHMLKLGLRVNLVFSIRPIMNEYNSAYGFLFTFLFYYKDTNT